MWLMSVDRDADRPRRVHCSIEVVYLGAIERFPWLGFHCPKCSDSEYHADRIVQVTTSTVLGLTSGDIFDFVVQAFGCAGPVSGFIISRMTFTRTLHETPVGKVKSMPMTARHSPAYLTPDVPTSILLFSLYLNETHGAIMNALLPGHTQHVGSISCRHDAEIFYQRSDGS